jgi:hypothetical protein
MAVPMPVPQYSTIFFHGGFDMPNFCKGNEGVGAYYVGAYFVDGTCNIAPATSCAFGASTLKHTLRKDKSKSKSNNDKI